MAPYNKKEYLITDKSTGKVVHEGADRRSILPNVSDLRTQFIITASGIILTTLLGLFGYCGDIAYKGILNSISDLKQSNESSYEKIYTRMSVGKANRDNQFSWVVKECCGDSATPPPTALPQ